MRCSDGTQEVLHQQTDDEVHASLDGGPRAQWAERIVPFSALEVRGGGVRMAAGGGPLSSETRR
jgi:hypothetical protein